MTLAVAFLAGLVSCISPCVLPVMPVFAGYIVGASGGARLASAPVGRAIGFLVGFLGVFVLLWASLGLVGFALLQTLPLARGVAGVLIVVLGVAMIAGYHPMISLPVGARLSGGAPVLLGAGVALGWTPCIGPTLGAILTLAASAPTVGLGTLLLLTYALGLAVPFVLVLVAYTRFRRLSGWFATHRRKVEMASGILVAGVGVLVFTGLFARLAGLFTFGVV
ncbi:MAG: cytochrome c biogenesis protein CcdA [Actinomycetota bacterium]|nr:cytochrome c biogenesis protein CcdA [Actinomycetota bacterium]